MKGDRLSSRTAWGTRSAMLRQGLSADPHVFAAHAAAPAAPAHLGADVWVNGAVRPATVGKARPSLEVGELAARILIVAGFSLLAVRFGAHFLQTGSLTGLMLLASEALVVVLTVFRRPTGSVDRTLRARVITTVALIGPLLLAPVVGRALVAEAVTAAVSAAGLLVVIVGKLSLGRSFGLMPANRGVVSTGLYRLVRHPIYMGYLVTHVAFLVANPTPWNIATLAVADLALMVRAVYEERVLALDEAYREYQQKVRWRVAPGVF
jgi:protein-S-isoprenylcysteine O-methyltransferase Ste14